MKEQGRSFAVRFAAWLRVPIVAGFAVGSAVMLTAQEPPAEVASLTAGQRLALEQIDQLIAAGAVDEVVPLIVRTIDEAEGRMVAVPRGAEFESDIVRYIPLRLFLHDRLLRWGVSHGDVLEEYRRRTDGAAQARLAAVADAGDFEEATAAAEEIFATSFGDEALLRVSDLALERGWGWRAIEALRRIDPRWQACDAGDAAAEVAAVGWEMLLPRISAAQVTAVAEGVDEALKAPAGWPLGCYRGSDLPQAEVGLRLVHAYLLVGEDETARRLAAMIATWFPDATVRFGEAAMPVGEAVTALIEQARRWPPESRGRSQWPTVAGAATRVYQTGPLIDVPLLPTWSREIEAEEVDRNLLPKAPPVGDLADAPATALPIIHRGLVLLPSSDSIAAFDLSSGAPWPEEAGDLPIFRDAQRDDLRVTSGELPVDGEPRFTLSASDGRVAGRFGPPAAGWLAVVRPRQSQSRVVLVDLEAEGQLVDGYPVRASAISSPDSAEFEGTPLIVGRRMYVGLTRRDDAAITSSVACIDVASGTLLFETPLVGSARSLSTEGRNRIGQALVSYREGIIYYHGDSGATAAIHAGDGSLRWVVRYPRGELHSAGYQRRRRAARVQLSPVAVLGPLAVVRPADSDRLIGLDPLDGRLLWATAPGEADDVDQVLGAAGEWIVAGGDSLYWIDSRSGHIGAAWPASVTRQPHGALPQPRRSGRGVMAGEEIYWPTAEAIWVFDAVPAGSRLSAVGATPGEGRVPPVARPLRRIDLRAAGLRGGHLAAADGVLIMASSDRLSAFAGPLAYTGEP